MKYITFTIPSYNSQEYMRHVIDNLVAVGDDIEVIIVNDGSKMTQVKSLMNIKANIQP